MTQFRYKRRYASAVAAWLTLAVSNGVLGGETDPGRIVPEPPLATPALLDPYSDPAFGTTVTRITSAAAVGASRMGPEYSQLQAWNADQSLMLLGGWRIVETGGYTIVHEVNFGPTVFGGGLRWSTTDSGTLFFTGGGVSGCSGGAFMRYVLDAGPPFSGQTQLVRCFPEYDELDRDPSFEELSVDGRYVGLVGVRPDGAQEIFAYDIANDIKHTALVAPNVIDWVAISPSGRYMIVLWAGGGTARNWGLEAFDIDMNYLGKVHTGNGHSDLTMDASGTEWAVITNANNAYMFADNHYLVKARIPDGVAFDGAGNVDEAATLARGSTTLMVQMDWLIGVHVSCRNTMAQGWCVVTGEGGPQQWQPFQDEIFLVYLDSTTTNANVDRIVHHRSSLTGYWETPFATASPDGTQIVYSSDWRSTSSIDGHIIDVQSTGPGQMPAPSGFRVE